LIPKITDLLEMNIASTGLKEYEGPVVVQLAIQSIRYNDKNYLHLLVVSGNGRNLNTYFIII
jgi:hypothetical protein